jgi:heme exporter protein C
MLAAFGWNVLAWFAWGVLILLLRYYLERRRQENAGFEAAEALQ